MGQYYKIVNIKKKQYISPYIFGDGSKLMEFSMSKNGVKETQAHVLRIYNPMNFEPVFKEDKRMVEIDDVLENGIREIQPLPAQDGNRDWGNYYYRKGEPTKPHTKYVDDVLEKGEKI